MRLSDKYFWISYLLQCKLNYRHKMAASLEEKVHWIQTMKSTGNTTLSFSVDPVIVNYYIFGM